MRLLPSGTPDPAFGAGGTVALPPAAAWLAPLPDGGAAAAGADADGRAWIARVSDTGAPAGSFRTPMELGGGWFDSIDTLSPLGGDLLSMDAAARPDGSLLLGGWVEVAGPEGPEGDGAPQAGQPLVAAFGADGALLPGFGRPTALGLGVRAAAQRYSRRGLAVRFRPRARGLARVRVTLGGRTVAQRMVPFRSQRALRIRIPWTRSGRARVAGPPGDADRRGVRERPGRQRGRAAGPRARRLRETYGHRGVGAGVRGASSMRERRPRRTSTAALRRRFR